MNLNRLSEWLERRAGAIFLWPAIVLMLVLAVFPLISSVFLALSRIQFRAGEVKFIYVGWTNFKKLLFGTEQTHFWGIAKPLTPFAWLLLLLVLALLGWWVWRHLQRGGSRGGLFYRVAVGLLVAYLTFWLLSKLSGQPGTVQVTLAYVAVGTLMQYLLGLGLALLCAQKLPGMRFFRVVFLLPLAITPVGVAYMFRMVTDTNRGPLTPLWEAIGLTNYSWATDHWGARIAVMIGDVWQWIPFMFIVLLAAIQSLPQENIEAALVDGASRWQTFRYIIFPFLIPVSITVILIRLIEAFKIVDLPNILTNGGPGTATESMTLQAFFAWRTLDLGGATAIAFFLLLMVSLITTAYATFILPKAR
jgi:multiple sugar transport system permease protein